MREKIKKNFEKKKWIFMMIVVLILILLAIYFFLKKDYKNFNLGNNMSNKTIEEMEEYILNIGSYEATVAVTVESNKNTNQYVLSQKFIQPNLSKQVVLEPSNIAGIETVYDGNTLTIHHSRLNTSTIYENYQEMFDNFLWLHTFIEDYKVGRETNQTAMEEKDGVMIFKTKVKNGNQQYVYQKELYVDKATR